jgi:hypothetical protein
MFFVPFVGSVASFQKTFVPSVVGRRRVKTAIELTKISQRSNEANQG